MTTGQSRHSSATSLGCIAPDNNDAFLLVDASGAILFLTDAFESLCYADRHELIGQSLSTASHHAIAGPLLRAFCNAIQSPHPETGRKTLLFPDNVERTILWEYTRHGDQALFVCHDARRHDLRQQAEIEIRTFESMGRLIDGVAHDINNVMTVISTYAEMIQEATESGTQQQQDADNILDAIHRVTILSRQLLSFSRQKRNHPTAINVSTHLAQSAKLMRKLMPAATTLDKNPASVWHTLIDPGYLDEIFFRLAALIRSTRALGGKLTVETRDVTQDTSPDSLPDSGEYVLIRAIVEDIPVSQSDVEQVQFFGLDTVLHQHNGILYIHPATENAPLEIRMYLPRLIEEPTSHGTPLSNTVNGSETLLLVEPDPAVRIATRMLLEAYGYRVLDADTGDSAMDQAATTKDLQLVLTDVCLADIDGPQLANQLQHRFPALKVLLMSGDTDAELARYPNISDYPDMLKKPLDTHLLARYIRTVLDTHTQNQATNSTPVDA